MMLIIAFSTLLYSGYRAEQNQINQTAREAGFELLKALNALQMIVDANRYTPEEAPNFLQGWTQVLMIDDLSEFVAPAVKVQAIELHTLWQMHFEQLQKDDSNHAITASIKRTRKSLKESIQNLH